MVHNASLYSLDQFEPASASQVQLMAFPVSHLMTKTSPVGTGIAVCIVSVCTICTEIQHHMQGPVNKVFLQNQ